VRGKKLRQFALAKNSLQLTKHEQEHSQCQNSFLGASTKVRNTLGERLAMKETNGTVFENFATSQHNRK
jgi:hypothetical protein